MTYLRIEVFDSEGPRVACDLKLRFANILSWLLESDNEPIGKYFTGIFIRQIVFYNIVTYLK